MRKAVAVLVGTAAAASAAASVAGAPAVSAAGFDNDSIWSDEVQLQNGGTVHSGNVVGMWQEILSAEFGLGEANVDGTFGTGTANYTAVYQNYYGITADGIVGAQTWNVARFVTGTTISSTPCTTCYYDYGGGPDLSLYWNSASGGTWKWSGSCYAFSTSPPSGYGLTDYPTKTYSSC